jgi:hypothetical protein
MQDASAKILELQARNTKTFYRKVLLYRREWNEVSGTYQYVSAVDITSYVKKAGQLIISQDQITGELKVSNITLTVDDSTDQFKQHYSGGYFDGYIAEYSQFQVELGYIDPETDLKHGLIMFTGVVAENGFREIQEREEVNFHIKGMMELLSKESAEDLADLNKVGKALNNDGDDKTYRTDENGVGRFRAVYSDGTLMDPVTDYTIEDLNEYGSPGTVVFGVAQAGKAITADYVHWFLDQSFKYGLEKIMEHCGITEYSIQDVTFPNNVKEQQIIDTKAEWDAGTLEDLYTEAGEDNLYHKIQMLSTPNWEKYSSDGLTTYTRVAQSFEFGINVTADRVGFALARDVAFIPRVEFSIQTDSGGQPSGVKLWSQEQLFAQTTIENGYIHIGSVNTALTANTTYWLVVEDVDWIPWFAYWRATDSPFTYDDGEALTYKNGVWSSYSNRDFIFYVQACNSSGTWMSDTLDCGDSLQSWGLLGYEHSGFGTFEYFTMSKSADAGWDGSFIEGNWDPIGGGGVINSDVERYIRIAIRITFYPIPIEAPPGDEIYMRQVVLNYFTSQFDIKMARWSGMTCKQVVDEYAAVAIYGYGFQPDGAFFFKAKDQDRSVDLTLYGVHYVHEVKKAFDRIRNRVITNFGNYQALVDSDTEGESSPHSMDKYGVKTLNISISDWLDDNDVDVALGSAKSNYDSLNALKYFTRLSANAIIQLEPSDVVRLQYYADPAYAYVFDDLIFDDHTFGDAGMPFGLNMRVLEIKYDLDNFQKGGMELKLLEV